MNYNFRFGVVWDALPALLQGAALSLSIAVVTMAIGLGLAVPLSLLASRGRGAGAHVARSWIEVARNTPCLLQIYVFFYGLGGLQIFLPAWSAVVIAICFNNAGYLAEIFRGGLATISPTQYKSSRSLGMNKYQCYRYIIFPQVMEKTFRSISNQFVWALLNTSLGAFIGLYELTGVAMDFEARTYRTFEFFIVIALLYFVMVKSIMIAARFLPFAGRLK